MKKACPGFTAAGKLFYNLSGFTLIELLVVASISSILFGLSLAGYRQFSRRQILNQAVQDLKSNLRFAQDKASAGEKLVGWCSAAGESLRGYRLIFVTDALYQIEAVCSSDDINVAKSVELPNSVSGIAGESVLFKVLGLGIDDAGDMSFTLSRGGSTVTVTVTRTGEIKIIN